jgi:choline dehydrogenase-like flavoprotein
MPEHYDVIVIGSGAGGGTMTHALAATGLRILLLERGGWYPREIENWSSRAVWGDLRYRNAGLWEDASGKTFNPKQHYYVGGNTKVYGAVLFRMREADFGPIAHVDGVSPGWPLGYAEFEPWYSRAEELYSVRGERGTDPTEPWASGPYPHGPLRHEPRIQQLSDDLAGAGLRPFPLPLGIRRDDDDPVGSACIRCATCDGFACIVDAKADAQTACIQPALRHPNVTLLTDARVTRLETTNDGRSVSRVLVDRAGQPEPYSADIVVLAAGAINSATLLLGSANDRHPEGLGNSSGVVGRNLMLHNNSSLIAISEVPNPTVFEKTLGVNDYYFGDGEWDFPLGAMQMLGKSDAFTMSLDAPDAKDPADLAARSLDFWLTTEDLPRWDNRVEVKADGGIRLSYEPTNLSAHKRLTDRFRSLLEAMRCREDLIDRSTYLGGRLGISGVAHQNGTVRFGPDPADSALDLNCRMHDVDNLYVTDASFFVSSSAVNPTLTIIANALRVAEHLKERLGVTKGPLERAVPAGTTG